MRGVKYPYAYDLLPQPSLAQLGREEGQTAIEYALVLALIAVVIVAAVATALTGVLPTIMTSITNAL